MTEPFFGGFFTFYPEKWAMQPEVYMNFFKCNTESVDFTWKIRQNMSNRKTRKKGNEKRER